MLKIIFDIRRLGRKWNIKFVEFHIEMLKSSRLVVMIRYNNWTTIQF